MAIGSDRTVVVTGVGCVTPIGNDVSEFWSSLLDGRNGVGPVTSFDSSPYRSKVGCEVKEFQAPLTRQDAGESSLDRASLLALAAGKEALEMAGLGGMEAEGNQAALAVRASMALSVGTTMGAPNFLDVLGRGEPDEDGQEGAIATASTRWREVLTHTASSITENVATELRLGGPQVSLPAACSAGNYAIGFALDLIRQGEAEAVLAGGSEAFSESAFAGFIRLNAMSTDLCRPFDRNRKGLLLGEGAGFLVMESEGAARRRGAPVLARVLGYGLSCDAHHITGPQPDGDGAVACIVSALRDARVDVSQIGYVSCHGTGTRHNDVIEVKAIRRGLGEHADRVAVSSIKALTGHMMGAASAVEAISCLLVLRESVLPPTWNLLEQDPECDLDVIPNEPREAAVEVVLNNSYAFGGNNACLILTRP